MVNCLSAELGEKQRMSTYPCAGDEGDHQHEIAALQTRGPERRRVLEVDFRCAIKRVDPFRRKSAALARRVLGRGNRGGRSRSEIFGFSHGELQVGSQVDQRAV